MVKIGEIINKRFQIKSFFANGLFGPMYLANDLEIKTEVLITFFLRRFLSIDKYKQGLHSNLIKTQVLAHQNIQRIYEIGVYQNISYCTGESIKGISLRSIIDYKKNNDEKFKEEEIYFIINNILTGLSYLKQFITIKIITAQNIFIEDNILKIIDFSLNNYINSTTIPEIVSNLNISENIAPELIDSIKIDNEKALVYSLATILYEMLNLTKLNIPFFIFNHKDNLSGKQIFTTCITKFPENRIESLDKFKLIFNEFYSELKETLINKISIKQDLIKFHTELKKIEEARVNTYLDTEPKRHTNIHILLNRFRKFNLFSVKSENKFEAVSIQPEFLSSKFFQGEEKTVLTHEKDLKQQLNIIRKAQGREKELFRILSLASVSLFFLFIFGLFTLKSFQVKSFINEKTINKFLLNDITTRKISSDEEILAELEIYMSKKKSHVEKIEEIKSKTKPNSHLTSAPLLIKNACSNDMVQVETIDGKYCIDKYEYPNKYGELPISNVSFIEAKNFCTKLNRKLCTKEQWELACTQSSSHGLTSIYSYGQTWLPSKCNTKDDNLKTGKPALSGKYNDCKNEKGLYDMIGNLAEWVNLDNYNIGVVIGGSYITMGNIATCNFTQSYNLIKKYREIGFRCCKN